MDERDTQQAAKMQTFRVLSELGSSLRACCLYTHLCCVLIELRRWGSSWRKKGYTPSASEDLFSFSPLSLMLYSVWPVRTWRPKEFLLGSPYHQVLPHSRQQVSQIDWGSYFIFFKCLLPNLLLIAIVTLPYSRLPSRILIFFCLTNTPTFADLRGTP